MNDDEAKPESAPEKASDRYLTHGAPLDVMAMLWPRGADLDPFHDPARKGPPLGRTVFDLRHGQDAYALDWGGAGTRVWANGPYSGGNPRRTAERVALYALEGLEIMNLCPAAPGSDYWKRFVWPTMNAIAWCGRLAFEAAVDMTNRDGELVCKKGEVKGGNRTEIALCYAGHEPERFKSICEVVAGWPAQVLRSSE